ncbi:MAG TPA: hypothetical protein VLG38_03655 [Gammaproteobacteria bacterium]|nr:hypothetical protein [Gammaproteobacteria bacterium]
MQKSARQAIIGLIAVWLILQPLFVYSYPQHTPKWTKVEQKFLAKSSRQPTYPHEYFAVIEVRNNYELGKLTALRFIEWVQHNPSGVVAFTSGYTPEFFIKFLNYYKTNWTLPEVQAELQSAGIHLKKFPNTSNLRLVQMEEIYPITEKHYKKISNYTIRHYAKELQIKPENLLLMDVGKKGILAEKSMNVVFMNGKVDLSIMNNKPASQVEAWQQRAIRDVREFCNEYENKIREWGGIDFVVAGVSYGGQLGFNELGGRADSKTHIVTLDYKTAAHGAKDFGGIDSARGKIAITIGMGTITMNPNAVMIILASGEAKAPIVRDAIESKTNLLYPATILQKYPNSRFYITDGAGKLLDDRQTEDLRFKSKHGWIQKHLEEVVIYVSLAEKKPILSLTANDFKRHARGRLLLENPPKPLNTMLRETHNVLTKRIETGLKLTSAKGSKVMHTSPHPEDVILGYYPLIDTFVNKYKNHFLYFTSGFNSVTDSYVLSTLNRANDWWLDKEQDHIFSKTNDKLINKFKISYHKQDIEQLHMFDTYVAMRSLVSIFGIKDLAELKHTIRWLKDEYFPNKQQGDLDVGPIKLLKGMLRESEAERFATIKNVPIANISHLRSKFYSGREFMRTPRYDTDVLPFINIYNKIKPDIITVQDDPDSAPPITNYRVLQIIAQGLRSKDAVQKDNLQILGYRNVWFRYVLSQPNSANIFVPVSSQTLAAQLRTYNSCFNSQKMSSFPSPFFDGDFAALTDTIQREQLADLKILLGADYFARNPVAEIRDAAGFVFMNQMSLNELFRRAEDLQPAIDLEEAYISNKH